MVPSPPPHPPPPDSTQKNLVCCLVVKGTMGNWDKCSDLFNVLFHNKSGDFLWNIFCLLCFLFPYFLCIVLISRSVWYSYSFFKWYCSIAYWLTMQTVDLIVRTQIHCPRGNFLMGTLNLLSNNPARHLYRYTAVRKVCRESLVNSDQHFPQFFTLTMHNIL